ncbi:hypothetical protein ACGFNY_37760 [Streptomyces chartreusis]
MRARSQSSTTPYYEVATAGYAAALSDLEESKLDDQALERSEIIK